MPYRLVVLLSSAALAAIFAVVGYYLYLQADRRIDIELAGEANRLHNVYAVQNEVLAKRTQALAYSLAANAEIQRLLDEGHKAVWAEGGGAGGPRAAALREALRKTVTEQWIDLHTRYGVDHLHFLLPGIVSFLRIRTPEHFGDSLAEIQPMLADVERDLDPRGSFVVAHTYAGMLGATAVTRPQSDGKQQFVGMLEIGYDIGAHLSSVSAQLDADIALLLDSERVDGLMWEAQRPIASIGQYYILATTRPEVADWLDAGALPPLKRKPQSHLLTWQGHQFQVVTFALDDYLSRVKAGQPPGTVLIWRDVTSLVGERDSEHAAAIRGAMCGYALAQTCILLLLRLLRRQWERCLKQSTATIEKLLRRNALLLDTAADGICGVDAAGNITFINRAALAIHGYRADEVMGKNPHHLFHHHRPDGRPCPTETCSFMRTLADGEARESEEWLCRRDGSFFPARIIITPIHEQERTVGVVVVFHDITEQRNRQKALLQLATTDSLTGASNRRHFLDQLEAEMARQRRHGGYASLLMSDLDFFKHVNDTHGHAAGDAVLSHFVHTVHQTVRRSDAIGRLGGEEFAILLPGDGIHGARELAERLRRTFEANPARIGNLIIPVTVSIGITELQADDMGSEAPLRRADEALYAAKAAGRNRIELYDPARRQHIPAEKAESTG
ncbi:MAG: diguanylate cyclase [Azoarcus sp.]|jgi:diguanylate cyclase (GGDEF)-like protein/PAS domain S-box-containing protein|nr:diguanylate cyclase [Azoarcus sp.]